MGWVRYGMGDKKMHTGYWWGRLLDGCEGDRRTMLKYREIIWRP
jgi:hypothetical protein